MHEPVTRLASVRLLMGRIGPGKGTACPSLLDPRGFQRCSGTAFDTNDTRRKGLRHSVET